MLFSTFVAILIVLVGSHTTNGAKGVDVSTYVSREKLRCLKQEGYDLLIVRGYRSNGRVEFSGNMFVSRLFCTASCTMCEVNFQFWIRPYQFSVVD